MNTCPKCGSSLNNDEKASGKCFTCDAIFESNLDPLWYTAKPNKNVISVAVKVCGIIIIIAGIILGFISANTGGNEYEFSLTVFIFPVMVNCISGIVLLGLSEIIQLLDDIKNKK